MILYCYGEIFRLDHSRIILIVRYVNGIWFYNFHEKNVLMNVSIMQLGFIRYVFGNIC